LRDEYESLWLDTLNSAKDDGYIEGDLFVLRRFLTGALSWTKTWFNPDGNMTIESLAEEALRLAIRQG